MERNIAELTQRIKQQALHLGFDACGISQAKHVGEHTEYAYHQWLTKGCNAEMSYLERNGEKRSDPRLLVEGTKSIISVALNYYPNQTQAIDNPQFAYYAYGQDYHDVMKRKLNELLQFIRQLLPQAEGRCFTDSAPVMESFWAQQAGIGYKGKHTLLIIPKRGTYFFLGEIFLNQELAYDLPFRRSLCGNCRRCIEACPTGALSGNGGCVDANKCISYQTIENKHETIAQDVAENLNNRVYGCDLCQQACPWNRYATPHSTPDFLPSSEFLSLTEDVLMNLTEEDFRRIFKGSAVKRAKYWGLMRNIRALQKEKHSKQK